MPAEGERQVAAGTGSEGAGTSTKRRPRSRQGEGGRLREELIEAASKILAREGRAEAVTLRGVAREVGVAAPSIYLHFADRDELLVAVLRKTFAQFGAKLARSTEGVEDPAAALRAGCRAYCEFATESPQAYAVLFSGVLPAEVWRDGTGYDTFEGLEQAVAAAIAAEVMDPGEPFERARRLWTFLHGGMSLRLAVPGFLWQPLEEFLDEALHEVGRLHRRTP